MHIHITGIVQGVGFRPFIHNLAKRHHLGGWVFNSSDGVFIEAEGDLDEVDEFIKDVTGQAPVQAKIESLIASEIKPRGEVDFLIKPSQHAPGKYQPVSPDIATCAECVRELFEPTDRRFRYPFINCTNCGPRFTIIADMPYDRPKTTMNVFKLCPDCQKEYDDPSDRRFHAQPNACAVCGPRLSLYEFTAQPKLTESKDPIKKTAELLADGKIVAIKGLGGFHLACDALDEVAVSTLRQRKRRFGKPLAIMVADLDSVRKLAMINDQEERLLLAEHRPIVLLRRLSTSVATQVAPNNDYLGVMLPYTPLHHLLMRETEGPLVMTSGNISEEPIAMENEEAFNRLGGIADYFLTHDREIYSRYDDSVVRVIDDYVMVIRRARGLAPAPVHLDFDAKPLLACGPELKSTFCLTRERHAFVSQHIGDLENKETLEHYEKTIDLYEHLFNIDPQFIAYDLHPEYLSTKYAQASKVEHKIAVQHHHAHIAACLAENQVSGPVIGVAFDGTGFGDDGVLWGGEFLVATRGSYERAAHLRAVPMPGGAAAIDNPYRMAISYLYSAYGKNYLKPSGGFWDALSAHEEALIIAQMDKHINAPLTTSCGRLFDAVAALAGVRGQVEFEGQAAIELEMAVIPQELPAYEFEIDTGGDDPFIIDTYGIIRGVMDDIKTKATVGVIATRFHRTVADMIVAVCEKIRKRRGINSVALSGGVFQNARLWTAANRSLRETEFSVLKHQFLPPNDGCIAFGQAIVANEQLKK